MKANHSYKLNGPKTPCGCEISVAAIPSASARMDSIAARVD
jgi:hypothetical protein